MLIYAQYFWNQYCSAFLALQHCCEFSLCRQHRNEQHVQSCFITFHVECKSKTLRLQYEWIMLTFSTWQNMTPCSINNVFKGVCYFCYFFLSSCKENDVIIKERLRDLEMTIISICNVMYWIIRIKIPTKWM